MLLSHLVIGLMIFTNWFDFAGRGLAENVARFNENVKDGMEDYIVKSWSNPTIPNINLNNYLSDTVTDDKVIAVIVDRNTGELIGNSLKMDNRLRFRDGTYRKIKISKLGYPALTKAYNSYLETNINSHKLKNIQSRLYIYISNYSNDEVDWLIITAMPENQFTKTITNNIFVTMVLSIIGVFISILTFFYIMQRLFAPADNLLVAIERFTEGDLSMRPLIVRNDEIGKVTRAFNNMADTIYGLVNNLEDKVRERTLELEKANQVLEDNRNHLRLILDSTAEGIYGMDIEGKCTFCNNSSLAILGYDKQAELIGKKTHYQIHHSKKDGSVIAEEDCKVIKAIKEGTSIHVNDEVFWRKDGSYFDVEYRVYPQIENGQVIGAVVTFDDISEEKKAQEQIDYLSFHDPVTGLYNRQFFENEIKRIDKNANLPISIIYGDVNGLKLINDILGHEKGDELLRKSAQVLTRICRDDDIVARLGGDEFVIILKNTEAKDAKKIIERIKSKIVKETISGIKGSISLGFDTKTSPDENIRDTLKTAEERMYRAKTLESKNVHSGMLDDIMEFLFQRSPREKLHSQNVSRISGQIATILNLRETDIRKVKDIGYYHDIGKIILDKGILNKDKKLSPEEKEEMERHTMIGYRILNLFNETMDIAGVVLAHHERWDGQGYPKGLKGKEIPLYARIIAVAEGYDSMTNKVSDKDLSHEEAIEDIKSKSGSKYDPEVVEAVLRI